MNYLKQMIKKIFLSFHRLGIKLGVYILPVHYYSPIPNIIELHRTRDVWAKKSELPGVAINLDEQASNLKTICLPYQNEYKGNITYQDGLSKHFGQGYGYIEAQALHAFMRYYKPQRIVEVGSGVTTYCMLHATEMNNRETGQNPAIISIEPYPSKKLLSLKNIRLIPIQVQMVPFDIFTELNQNDLLFIDSSHTVKPGGDVNYLILEVLPRLKKGVIVHFHDIYLPYDYQRDVDRSFLHWAETSLLHAFLIHNDKYKIISCLSLLHYEREKTLREVFPEYIPRADINGLDLDKYKSFEHIPGYFPSSIYLQVQ